MMKTINKYINTYGNFRERYALRKIIAQSCGRDSQEGNVGWTF